VVVAALVVSEVFLSESATGKLEIYVSQVKTIEYYKNKKSQTTVGMTIV